MRGAPVGLSIAIFRISGQFDAIVRTDAGYRNSRNHNGPKRRRGGGRRGEHHANRHGREAHDADRGGRQVRGSVPRAG